MSAHSTTPPSTEAIEDWLIAHIAQAAKMDPADVDPRDAFADYGLSSIAAVGLSGDLEDWLGLRLPTTLVWDYPTIQSLAEYLSEQVSAKQASGA